MSATTSNPAIAKVMFSSASDDWATPQGFYDALDAEFGFVLDACSSTTNHKAPHFFALDHPEPERRDGLAGDWAADARSHQGAVWLNPVYGRTIGDWMAKAAETARGGATVVCLVPARTDTRWFHDHVLAEGAEVRYVRGRLKFGSATTGAPFASLVVIYRGHPTVQAAEEPSAEVVTARPQHEVQDVLELGDGDGVRPGPSSDQVPAPVEPACPCRPVGGAHPATDRSPAGAAEHGSVGHHPTAVSPARRAERDVGRLHSPGRPLPPTPRRTRGMGWPAIRWQACRSQRGTVSRMSTRPLVDLAALPVPRVAREHIAGTSRQNTIHKHCVQVEPDWWSHTLAAHSLPGGPVLPDSAALPAPALPGGQPTISRAHLFALGRAAATDSRDENILRLLWHTLSWGTGTSARNNLKRVQSVAADPVAAADALRRAARTARHDPEAAFACLRPGRRHAVAYLGPAFFTKFLYAAGGGNPDHRCLILDARVATALRRRHGWHPLHAGGPWPASTYGRYCALLGAWAAQLSSPQRAVAADELERWLFDAG